MEEHSSRDILTTAQRTLDLELRLDPMFVNHRLIGSIFGDKFIDLVNQRVAEIPPNVPEWQKNVQIDHIYTSSVLYICKVLKIPSLGALINFKRGHLFNSTEEFLGSDAVYDDDQASLDWIPSYETDYKVRIDFSTRHITGDTARMMLSRQETYGVVGQFQRIEEDNVLVFRPVIMGSPWLTTGSDIKPDFDIVWHSSTYYEIYPEDFDEFSLIKEVGMDEDWSVMGRISEFAFKQCICELLCDTPQKDWSGESSDHYTAGLHLNGKRISAALLLKGPANFTPMTAKRLGKNGDQIFRLSTEPADILIVQHCHEITPAVRATLRAFAVQPGRARRYCLIDGKDSYRLLKAYGLLEKALSLSEKNK